jgi:cysteine-rich repeat protein
VVDPRAGETCDDGGFLSHDGCDSQCHVETLAWVGEVQSKPGELFGAAMVHDVKRSRFVLFGGSRLGSAVVSMSDATWEFDGQVWVQALTPTSPLAREQAGLVYDVARGRTVLFGGRYQSSPLNDTWEWDGGRWHALTPASSPRARFGHGMAYDASRRRVVLFGGSGSVLDPETLDDTWEWDGADWIARAPATSPPPLVGSRMTYDPIRGETVLFGGSPGGGAAPSGATWTWDGTDWAAQVPATSPDPRGSHGLSFDALSGTVLLHGGVLADHSASGETWAWDGAGWTQVTLTDPPAGRYLHALACSPDPDVGCVVHGGYNLPSSAPTTLRRSTGEWEAVNASLPPAPRTSAAMVLDRGRGCVLLFGGWGSGGTLDETWAHCGHGWRRLTDAFMVRPPARSGHGMAYDELRERVVVQGGHGASSQYLTDTWAWDGATWSLLPTTTPPTHASGVSMAYDAARDRMVLFGASGGPGPGNQTWELDGTSWLQVTPAHLPTACYGSALAYDARRERVVTFGGTATGNSDYQEATFEWDGTDWTDRTPDVFPPGRASAGMTYDELRGRVVLFGGEAVFNMGLEHLPFDDTWDFDGVSWAPRVIVGTPEVTGSSLIAFDPFHGRLLLLDGGGSTWLLTRSSGLPEEQCRGGFDADGDGLVGCDDPDCWAFCTPSCPPGTPCDETLPHCGDGTCSALETCRMCPDDCGSCAVRCGDFHCDEGEDVGSCPGDCG